MWPEYNTREENLPQYLIYWYQRYQQNLPYELLYNLIYIPLPMRYVCRWYYLITYKYTYRMGITTKSGNKCYEVLWYIQKKTIYSHIYTSTYNVRVRMLLPKHVLVDIRDENDKLILLSYVSNFYAKHYIRNKKLKWMKIDTTYDLILNAHLFHIHHIRNSDIFVTQYNIMNKCLSAINTSCV